MAERGSAPIFWGGGVGTEIRTDTAIIRALRRGITALWPSEWLVIYVEQGIFLLETEPWFDFLCLVHDLLRMVAVVGLVGSSVVVVGLSEDENVLSTTEGIPEDGSRAKVDIRVVTGGLVRGRAIKVPHTKIANVGDALGDRLQGRRVLEYVQNA